MNTMESQIQEIRKLMRGLPRGSWKVNVDEETSKTVLHVENGANLIKYTANDVGRSVLEYLALLPPDVMEGILAHAERDIKRMTPPVEIRRLVEAISRLNGLFVKGHTLMPRCVCEISLQQLAKHEKEGMERGIDCLRCVVTDRKFKGKWLIHMGDSKPLKAGGHKEDYTLRSVRFNKGMIKTETELLAVAVEAKLEKLNKVENEQLPLI